MTTAATRNVSSSYVGAVDHYLSTKRRDAVKATWEEPATQRLLESVVDRICTGDSLRVLDIGCGAGEGLSLLRSLPRWRVKSSAALHYTGLDLDAGLLEAARYLHGEGRSVRFEHGDMREGIPPGDYNLFLSCGVPFSHLTVPELEEVLATLLSAADSHCGPAVVVVDVLGRYSIEWTPRWAEQRWPYRMSFFETGKRSDSTDMTFHSGVELCNIISSVARSVGFGHHEVTCHDRSIMVGRHTTTAEYAHGLRPYRRLVNELIDPGCRVEYKELLFDVDASRAPVEVREFFGNFSKAWDELVKCALDQSRFVSRETETAVLQPMLARGLERLEAVMQRGLGVGHSLTAVAFVE